MTSSTRRRVVENYALEELIGSGVYGKVFKSTHKTLPDIFAIKVVPVQMFKDNKKLEECTINQINILSSIKKSPHIVKYVQMLKTSNNFYFVYEFCNGGTLEELLKKEKKFDENKALDIMRQLVEAFKILNEYNIMHRDVKPDNILFHDGVAKLGDFGFCKSLVNTDMTSTMLGSPIYMAPQVLKGETYTSKADIWSLGVVLFQMFFGYCPFQSNSIANLISTIKDTKLRLPLQINNISQNSQQLVKRMLIKDHTQRITWKQIFSIVLKDNFLQKKQNKNSKESKTNFELSIDNFAPYIQPVNNGSKHITSSLKPDDRVRPYSLDKFRSSQPSISSSLSWQNDTGYKAFLSNNLKSISSKLSIQSSLTPNVSEIKCGVTHIDSLQKKPVSSIPSVASAKKQDYLINKRKDIVSQHELCTKGIKTSIDIIDVQDRNTVSYSYIILIHVQSRLRTVLQSIQPSEFDLQDIAMTIHSQLRTIQKSIRQLKQQLQDQQIDMRNLSDPKIYLSVKFRQNVQDLKTWYDMVNVLFGDKITMNTRQKTKADMVEFIRGKINSCY